MTDREAVEGTGRRGTPARGRSANRARRRTENPARPGPQPRRSGAPRGAGRARHRLRALPVVAGLALVLLATGCAAMPDTGPVQRSDQNQKNEQNAQVRVFGQRPSRNEQPVDLVTGFLEATTTDDAAYATAKDYLTPERRRAWKPGSSVAVLENPPVVTPMTDSKHPDRLLVLLTGREIGVVDEHGAYHPEADGVHSVKLHYWLSRGRDKQWRIDELPDGLVLTQDDFQRIYRPANLFYLTAYDDGRERTLARGRPLTVPDRVYLRRRDDPVTALMRALLRGPSHWLEPVAATAVPHGAELAHTGLDDDGTYEVRLKGRVLRQSGRCPVIAAQATLSIADLTGAKNPDVRLVDASGAGCHTDLDSAKRYSAPDADGGVAGLSQYFVDHRGRIVSLMSGQLDATPVTGALGTGATRMRSVGVRRDQTTAAGVSSDGRRLYLSRIDRSASLHEVSRSGATGSAPGFTAPSWDTWGGLWVADTTSEGSQVYLFSRPGDGDATTVHVSGLGGRRITALRVSADGTRAAMLVTSGGKSTALVGRIEHDGSTDDPRVAVRGLRQVAPELADVTSLTWSGPNQLVVLGKERRGAQQMFAVDVDGSRMAVPPMVGAVPSGVRSVTASELGKTPLLVDTSSGEMWRQDQSSAWQPVTQKGSEPVYPG